MASLKYVLIAVSVAGGFACLAVMIGGDLKRALDWARVRSATILRAESVRIELAQAGLDTLPVPAWIIGRVAGSLLVGSAIGLWFGLPILGLIAFLVSYHLAGVGLEVRRRRFESRRQEALLESVRHGVAVMSRSGNATQMIEALAAGGPSDVRAIFREIAQAGASESGHGMMADAIERIRDRLADPLFDDLALGLTLHWRQGGKLVPALEAIAQDWGETLRLQQEAKSLRAGVEASVVLLAVLPFVFLITLQLLAPALLLPFRSPGGEVVFGLAVGWMAVGYGVLQRMSQQPRETRLQLRKPST